MISINRWDCWTRRVVYLAVIFVPLAFYLRIRWESHVLVPLLQDVLALLAAVMVIIKLAFTKRSYRFSVLDILVLLFVAYNVALVIYCLITDNFLTAAYIHRSYIAGALIYFACRSSLREQDFLVLLKLFFMLGVIVGAHFVYDFFLCNVLGRGLPDWVLRASDYVVSTGRGGELWWSAKDYGGRGWYYLPGLLGSKHATPAFIGACAVAFFAYWSATQTFRPYYLTGFLFCSAAVLISMNVTSILTLAGVLLALLLAQMRRSFFRSSFRMVGVLCLLIAVGVCVFKLNPSSYRYAFFEHFDAASQSLHVDTEETTIFNTAVPKETSHRGVLFKIFQTPIFYLDMFAKNPLEGLFGSLPILPLFGHGHGLFFFAQWGVIGVGLMLYVIIKAIKAILLWESSHSRFPAYPGSFAAAGLFWVVSSLHNEGFIDSFACYYWWFACLAGLQATADALNSAQAGNYKPAAPIEGVRLEMIRGSHG